MKNDITGKTQVAFWKALYADLKQQNNMLKASNEELMEENDKLLQLSYDLFQDLEDTESF
ncbi:MAG: hypothetical protein ATN35_01050 [Epulopiscium sp. Nele67-Bin004]|nr:MAG: hypothetical protein ATN35_01050 [Epulopiscium sp. Nele67-Bin004]